MSYLYSFVVLFICKRWWIDCLGWGRGGCLSAVVCLWLCSFCLERFPLSQGTLDGVRCFFFVALPQPSMWLFFKIYDYCDVLRTLYL